MNKLKILIVEDESLVAMDLQESIELLGYEVIDYATSCDMAIEIMQSSKVDLILMDINLRDTLNGIELYRSFNTNIPVIYITAYKDDETIAQAVETDPLGYLIKPHDENELNAILKLAQFKIQHHLTNDIAEENTIILGEGYTFKNDEQKLFFEDHYIRLGPNELKLLRLLIKERGNIVSYKHIESEIWQEKTISNSALRTLIYRLRGKLEYKFIDNEFDYGIKLI
ncbi:MAG: response regulator [Campylobacterota bacterium]|nr:response regulator [Campylobacterota bacterium]